MPKIATEVSVTTENIIKWNELYVTLINILFSKEERFNFPAITISIHKYVNLVMSSFRFCLENPHVIH